MSVCLATAGREDLHSGAFDAHSSLVTLAFGAVC